METTSNWIPNLHPILVHFPIALLFAAIGIELTGLVLRKYQQASFIADILIWIGTVLAIFTVISGLQGADVVTIPDAAMATVASHSLTGKIVTAFFTLYSVIRLFRYRRTNNLKMSMMITILIMGCVGLFGIYLTGKKGAELVYKYGVGISTK